MLRRRSRCRCCCCCSCHACIDKGLQISRCSAPSCALLSCIRPTPRTLHLHSLACPSCTHKLSSAQAETRACAAVTQPGFRHAAFGLSRDGEAAASTQASARRFALATWWAAGGFRGVVVASACKRLGGGKMREAEQMRVLLRVMSVRSWCVCPGCVVSA